MAPIPPAPYPGQPTPYPGYGAYPGYGVPGYTYPGYGYNNIYGYQNWSPLPPKARRDTYLLVVTIIAFICSILVFLGGLASLGILGLFDLSLNMSTATTPLLTPGTSFAAIMLFLTFGIAGIAGGGICGYHSIRSLFARKPSIAIWLPRFWIFLLCYLVTLGTGFCLHTQSLDVTWPALTGLLIYLGAIFPALATIALGIRRLSFPRLKSWPTTWRRLTLALVSGATLGVGLALILETLFQ